MRTARVEQEGPGDGDALALAAGEGDAALAHPLVVAVGQAHDEVVDAGCLGGRLDLLLRGLGPSVGDVVAHGADEEEDILLDGADAGPQGLELEVANVDPIDGDRALGHVVEARQEVDDGGLAAAGGAERAMILPGGASISMSRSTALTLS